MSANYDERAMAAELVAFPLPRTSRSTFDDAEELDQQLREATEREEITASRGRRFRLIRAADIQARPIDWLIADYFERGATIIIHGDPESLKTFLVLDVGLHLAAGKDWHGRSVESRKHTVVYIGGEGQRGIGRRVEGWCRHHQVERSSLAFFVSNIPGNFTDPARRLEMMTAIREDLDGMAPDAVIVDTLARNLGGDENSNEDINLLFALIDSELRGERQCAVILVGHPGHGDKMRPRGGSALIGNTDADARVERGVGLSTTYWPGKMKDAPRPPPIAFEALEVESGEGSTLVLRALPDSPPPAPAAHPGRKQPTGRNQQKALALLGDLYTAHRMNLEVGGRDIAQASVMVADWRQRCCAADIEPKRFREVQEALEQSGLIRVDGLYVYLEGAK